MVRHTLRILQHLLQDFLSVPDHFDQANFLMPGSNKKITHT